MARKKRRKKKPEAKKLRKTSRGKGSFHSDDRDALVNGLFELGNAAQHLAHARKELKKFFVSHAFDDVDASVEQLMSEAAAAIGERSHG